MSHGEILPNEVTLAALIAKETDVVLIAEDQGIGILMKIRRS